ncbi:MAG: hypothetical protein N3D85_01365 [Candidatus Bathyarchaeota archaeon]|nr:hypothetical protein [Candidatus Bathyarchaeota archaeon]
MIEIKIDASKIKDDSAQLATFIKEKTSGDITTEGGILTLKTEGVGVNKKYVRVLLKKFLHQRDLKETHRVIGGEENLLIISERKVYEA